MCIHACGEPKESNEQQLHDRKLSETYPGRLLASSCTRWMMRNHSPSNHTAFKRDLNVENMLCISNHMATHVRIYYYYTILYYVILLPLASKPLKNVGLNLEPRVW